MPGIAAFDIMTASSRTTTGGVCPYTALFSDDSSSHGEDSELFTEKEQLHPTLPASPEVLKELKEKCPAFSQNSCPFKDATSANEVREMISKVPPSHMDPESDFFKVMKGMHVVQRNATVDPSFVIQGGCPLGSDSERTDPTDSASSDIAVTDALEGSSLAALMARMAEELEHSPTHEDGATLSSDDTAKENRHQNHQNRRLSESLKIGTAVSHQAAEDVHFVKDFIRGKIDRRLYSQLVTMLFHVYAALEECLDEHAPSRFPSCHFPIELRRKQSLQEDMDFWHGNTQSAMAMTAATKDYVDRIQYLAHHDPLLLLAHAYTRYLGDLSGGRILARVARKAMNLGEEGLAFYEFQDIESPKKFKDQYRKALDELFLTAAEVQKLVAEANVAFVLNMRLFEELDVMANLPGSTVRPLADALAYSCVDASRSKEVSSDKCPFLEQSQQKSNTTDTSVKGKRCPWPFILAHDPQEGLKDWQTWVVIGLLLGLVWSRLKA